MKYTTYDPKTNTFTKEEEYINAWKWDTNSKINDKYTRVQLQNEKLESLQQELETSIKLAAKENKRLENKNKELRKTTTEKIETLKPYLKHKTDCDKTLMQNLGKSPIRARCTCGLSKIIY